MNISCDGVDTAHFVQEVIPVLLGSPRLRNLALSFQQRYSPRGFLTELVTAYVSRGGEPLNLRCLALGHACGLYDDPWSSWGTGNATQISQLTDLATLQDVALGKPADSLSDAVAGPLFRDLTGLQSIAFDFYGIRIAPGLPNDIMRHLPELTHSLRPFSALFLDRNILELIGMIGNDLTLPSFFLSELSFSCCVYRDDTWTSFALNGEKLTYWPRHFSIGEFRTGNSPPEDKRHIVRQLYK